MRLESRSLREAWQDARLAWFIAALGFLSLALDNLAEGDWWWVAPNVAGVLFTSFSSWLAHNRIPPEPHVTVNITADASQFNAAVDEAIRRLNVERRVRNGGDR